MTTAVLTRGEHDESVDVEVGQSLSVQLDESPTSGYVWVDRTEGDVLTLEASDHAPAAAGAIGGAGLRTLRYRVKNEGTATVLLKLAHEWEPDASAIDTFSATVHATRP